MARVNKTLLTVVVTVGGIIMLCCGAYTVVALLSREGVYSDPKDICATSAVASVAALGEVRERRREPLKFGTHPYQSCVLTLDAGGVQRTLTVAVDVPPTMNESKAHYNVVYDGAVNGGARVEKVNGLGDRAFAAYTLTDDQLVSQLGLCDDRLYLSLQLVTGAGPRPADVRDSLRTVATEVMRALKE
ncbi:hypothetical protein [Dactylosporangium sp. CA-139066]|uniref:hypothetical protein n=1 Tax=Dactylosporangium sp. CA-139066 TaxID=3239930 RepID=UPI003D94D501